MSAVKELYNVGKEEREIRSVGESVAVLDQLSATSASLVRKPLPSFEVRGREYYIPRYLFLGPKGGAEPIRVGFFAGVHGDEPEGSFALIDFVQLLEEKSEIAKDFCLFVYPITNPSGFESGSRLTVEGVNIPNQLWKNSVSSEVQVLQAELWMHGFDGVISFRTDPNAREVNVAIGGPVFFRHLLEVTLPAAQDILPQNVQSGRNALPRWKSVLLEEPNELIRAAPGLQPRPFEIVITLPRLAPRYLLKSAVSLLLESILAEYRKFISFGANL